MTKTEESWRSEPRTKQMGVSEIRAAIEEAESSKPFHIHPVHALRIKMVLAQHEEKNGPQSLKHYAEKIAGYRPDKSGEVAWSQKLNPNIDVAPKNDKRAKTDTGLLYQLYINGIADESDILYIITGKTRTKREKELEAQVQKLTDELEQKKAQIKMMTRGYMDSQ